MSDEEKRTINICEDITNQLEDRISELEEHDIFKIWDSLRKGGKTTLGALLKNAESLDYVKKTVVNNLRVSEINKEVLRELIQLISLHSSFVQDKTVDHLLEKLKASGGEKL